MIKWILQKIVGSKNQRELRRIKPTVERIKEIEEALQQEPEEKLREHAQKWRTHLSRYHDLDAPTKPALERMESAEIQEAADLVEARIATLREEFPLLPGKVEANVDSIEAAKSAFREVEPEFRQARARYLDQILPDAYAVVKNAARRMCGTKIMVRK